MLVAAAVTVGLALVGVSVWQFGAGSDDESSGTVAADPEQRYLVAGDLPDGFGIIQADDDLSAPDEMEVTDSQVAVYGDPAAEDPWNGPLIVLIRSEASSPGWWAEQDRWTGDDAPERETIAAGGRDWAATVEPRASAFGDVLAAESVEGAVAIQLSTFGLDQNAFHSAVEQVADGSPAVGGDGLPEGFEELARGPHALMSPASYIGATGSFTGLAVAYGESAEPVPSNGHLAVMTLTDVNAQALSLPYAFNLLMSAETTPDTVSPGLGVRDLEVRGQPAVATRFGVSQESVTTEDGEVDDAGGETETSNVDSGFQSLTVQWFEPEIDAMVVVSARNLDDDQVFSLIDGLREAEPGEVEELVEAHPPSPLVTGESTVSEAGEVAAVEECAVTDGDDRSTECTTVTVPAEDGAVSTEGVVPTEDGAVSGSPPAPESGAEVCEMVEEEPLTEGCGSVEGPRVDAEVPAPEPE